ncbi:tetratricopeptide repeat protein [bacterium]|nr:tetratricopeptide repeat protein [bacterium]
MSKKIISIISILILLVSLTEISSAKPLSKKEQKTYNKALKFEHKNNYKSALNEYNKILKTNPTSSEALDRISYIQMKNNERKKAEETAKKAIKAGGKCPISKNIIGMMHEKNNNLGYAEKYYLRALKDDNKYASAYNNLGNIALKIGMVKKASSYYEQAIANEPKNPLFFNNLGYAMELNGEIADALEYYQKADKIGDPSGLAKKNIERIEFKNKEKHLTKKELNIIKNICKSKFPITFHVTEVLNDPKNGNAGVWEASSAPNQRFIIKQLPKDNAFTEMIFSQMVFEHKEELLSMLEKFSKTTQSEIIGQGYINVGTKRIMYVSTDSYNKNIPLETMYCLVSKESPDRNAIIVITANKGFFKSDVAKTFIKTAYKGL